MTERSLRLGNFFKRKAPDKMVICQMRDRPTISISAAILDLPGHSNQGCEVYACMCPENGVHFGFPDRDWRTLAFLLVTWRHFRSAFINSSLGNSAYKAAAGTPCSVGALML
ncbi:hypothetical protein PENPOL_c001G07062 [Penicillium polonicum]|uniref:Uncharacterized protein n=1 Tax=Penicillium polonicum TaxID=60169 RepID=A0A1V6P5L9_PENPO|nr:hypothetical protein PENPOL_c001G07062 [Penicillium polonicum]